MTKATVKKQAVVTKAKSDYLVFWDKVKKEQVEYDYAIPATKEVDGEMCANLNVRQHYNKEKQTFSLILTLGDTKHEMFIGSSVNRLGSTYAYPPKLQEAKKNVVSKKLG